MITLGLSTALAAFGLLIGSSAVIIGAMVVAPLMTPLTAGGLSLVRGDVDLFKGSMSAMIVGSLAGFIIAVIIGLITPRDTLTVELLLRGKPSILDLMVALIAGAAGAYATARPKVLAALAGVAIAAALVPPLAASGIALANGFGEVARGAAVLFVTNLVAIILGSAATYRLMGVRGKESGEEYSTWLRRCAIGFVIIMGLLVAPLGYRTASNLEEGQLRPATYPVSLRLSKRIEARIAEDKEVNLVFAGRSGIEEGQDIIIMLSAPNPVSKNLKDDLEKIINDIRGEHATTTIMLFRSGRWK